MSDSPAERVLSVGGHDIGYPHGHLGYLTQDEENTLQNFKVFLEEKGLYKSGDKPSHDDQTLLYVLFTHFGTRICRLLCPTQALLARKEMDNPRRLPAVQGYGGVAQGQPAGSVVRHN